MLLAESPQIGPGLLLLILVPVLLFFLATVGLAYWGCVLAKRAGEGSRRAMTGWAIIAALELAFMIGLAGAFSEDETRATALFPAAALGLQVTLFMSGRKR